MSGKKRSEFWWATVGGSGCEPVEVTVLGGERVAYTCGCSDPFYLDRPGCVVVLVPTEWDFGAVEAEDKPMPLERPLTPKQEKAQERAYARKLKADRSAGIHHGWRGSR